MRNVLFVLVLVATLVGMNVGPVLAQTGPPMTPVETPTYVSPEFCTPEPADLDRVQSLMNDPLATPEGSIEDLPLIEDGEVVSDDDAVAVRELMVTMLACINADQPARFLSLFSDEFFHHASGDVADIVADAEEAESDEETVPLDEGYALVTESEVRRLEDGRYTYAVGGAWVSPETDLEQAQPDEIIQIVVNAGDGDMLIDDLRVADLNDPGDEPDCGDNCGEPEASTPVEGSNYSGWIMTADIAEEAAINFLQSGNEVVISGFAPTEEDVAEAESVLPFFLRQQERATENLIEQLPTYQRQYLGIETDEGRFLIINGFCDTVGIDPLTSVVVVEDGGDCFWHAVYDLETRTFERLLVNGES